jgi:hypothetical protein
MFDKYRIARLNFLFPSTVPVPTSDAMWSLIHHVLLVAHAAHTYALPYTSTGKDDLYVPPFVRVPQAFGPQVYGAPPTTILLNTADLLTPGTIISGSPVSRIPSATLEGRDIIGGVDNRVLQGKTGNPWDHIGSLAWSDGGRCSGSLVGPRHLATARHCFDTTAGSQITYQFRPNYDLGTRGYTTATVTSIFALAGTTDYGNPCSVGDDWAVAILDQRLGDTYGWFGMRQFNVTKANQPIFWNEGWYSFLFLSFLFPSLCFPLRVL